MSGREKGTVKIGCRSLRTERWGLHTECSSFRTDSRTLRSERSINVFIALLPDMTAEGKNRKQNTHPLYCRTCLIASTTVIAALTAHCSKRRAPNCKPLTPTRPLKSGEGSYMSPCNRRDTNLGCVLYVEYVVVVKISLSYTHNALVATIVFRRWRVPRATSTDLMRFPEIK